MKKLYFSLICVCLFVASLTAQGTIDVPPNLDPLAPTVPATNLSKFVDDNNAGGTVNTYVLERGARYYFDALKEWDFDVAFIAKSVPDGGVDAGMPIIQRFNPGTTNYAPMWEGTANFMVDGVHLILGEEGDPQAGNYENASIRPRGENQRLIFRNSRIEKSRQAVARVEGDGVKAYIENCYVLNMGDYQQFQGNGRLIDVRSTFADSVVIRNNVISNILDRLYIGLRQRGNNYFEFTSNTVFNHVGRHGLIQLSNTKETKINNNLFSNPKMMGTTPSISDEQIGEVGVVTYLFTADSTVAGGSIEMKNNNIFYTDDVLAYFASADTVEQCPTFGPNFLTLLGTENQAAAVFTEVVELNSVPPRAPVLKYTMEAINDRASRELTDIMVEPESRRGSIFDNQMGANIFDFSTFDPCYSSDAASFTAATDGGAVGARSFCGLETVSTRDLLRFNPALQLKSFPNPTNGQATLTYTLTESGPVSVTLYDASGKQAATIFTGTQTAGDYTVTFDKLVNMPAGIYFANLFTQEGRMYTRIVKH